MKFNFGGNIDKVKDFIDCTNKCVGNVDVKSGHYVVDGRSIMGVLSLDYGTDFEIVTYNEEDEKRIAEFIENYK